MLCRSFSKLCASFRIPEVTQPDTESKSTAMRMIRRMSFLVLDPETAELYEFIDFRPDRLKFRRAAAKFVPVTQPDTAEST
jgi:hypothetical protein